MRGGLGGGDRGCTQASVSTEIQQRAQRTGEGSVLLSIGAGKFQSERAAKMGGGKGAEGGGRVGRLSNTSLKGTLTLSILAHPVKFGVLEAMQYPMSRRPRLFALTSLGCAGYLHETRGAHLQKKRTHNYIDSCLAHKRKCEATPGVRFVGGIYRSTWCKLTDAPRANRGSLEQSLGGVSPEARPRQAEGDAEQHSGRGQRFYFVVCFFGASFTRGRLTGADKRWEKKKAKYVHEEGMERVQSRSCSRVLRTGSGVSWCGKISRGAKDYIVLTNLKRCEIDRYRTGKTWERNSIDVSEGFGVNYQRRAVGKK